MAIDAKDIELFRNLAQWDLESVYYDFHNDFICILIKFGETTLTLKFRRTADEADITVSFLNTTIVNFEFTVLPESDELRIDLLYRGRFEKEGQLLETDENGRAYFYLEFCDEQKIEFFSGSISIVS